MVRVFAVAKSLATEVCRQARCVMNDEVVEPRGCVRAYPAQDHTKAVAAQVGGLELGSIALDIQHVEVRVVDCRESSLGPLWH